MHLLHVAIDVKVEEDPLRDKKEEKDVTRDDLVKVLKEEPIIQREESSKGTIKVEVTVNDFG